SGILAGTNTGQGTLTVATGSTLTYSTGEIDASKIGTTASSTNATYYPTFVSATSGNNQPLVNTGLNYNPSTNTLTAGTFVGNVTGSTGSTITADQLLTATAPGTLNATTANSYTVTAGATFAGKVTVSTTSTPSTIAVVINDSKIGA